MLKIKSYDQEITFLVIFAKDSKKIYTHTHTKTCLWMGVIQLFLIAQNKQMKITQRAIN